MKRGAIAALCIALVASCFGFGDQEYGVLSEVPERMTYAEVSQIMAVYCLRCHNQANVQGDFQADSYELVYAKRQRVRARIQIANMPPLSESPMSLVDRRAMLQWVDDGAPFE
jgi:hypothetical protein